MAMEELRVGKRGCEKSGFTLILGDTNTQIVRMIVQRYYGGVDLGRLTWSVVFENAAGKTDTHYIADTTVMDTVVLCDWKVHGFATSDVGITRFQLEGFAEDNDGDSIKRWQSGQYAFNVTDDINADTSPEEDEALTEVQKLILYIDGTWRDVEQAGEDAAEASKAANAAASSANAAASSANTAADNVNEAVTAAETAADKANAAAERASTAAESAEEARDNIQGDLSSVKKDVSALSDEIREKRIEWLVNPDRWPSLSFQSDNNNWVSNKRYKRGTIKRVITYIYGTDERDIVISVYKDNGDGTMMQYDSVTFSGVGLVSHECDIYVDTDFYIAIKGKNVSFENVNTGMYYAKSISTNVTTIPDESNSQYHHAYALEMLPIMDEKLDTRAYEEDRVKSVNIEVTAIGADTEYENVLTLPANKIYRIAYELDNVRFGLPAKAHATLFKYRPFTDSTGKGFTVYEYTALLADQHIERYIAYAVSNQTLDTFRWKKISTAANTAGIYELGVKAKSIVFIGDSIVEGYGSSDYNGGASGTSGHLIPNNIKTWYRNTGAKCWANRMIAYLTENYPNVTACNNGIGGLTATGIYNNLETLTLDDNGNRADVVVLSIGTNNRNASDIAASLSAPLRKTIEWLCCRGIQPIVLTNTPLYNSTASEHTNNTKTARIVQSAIKKACEDAGIRSYDLLSAYYDYLWQHNMDVSHSTILNDPLHPNDLGYEIAFNLIKRLISV